MILEIDVVCSDPGCAEEEFQVWAKGLDAVEEAVCRCGHSVLALRVAAYEPELPIRLTRATERELAGAA
jgi:hypothetical protein